MRGEFVKIQGNVFFNWRVVHPVTWSALRGIWLALLVNGYNYPQTIANSPIWFFASCDEMPFSLPSCVQATLANMRTTISVRRLKVGCLIGFSFVYALAPY